MEMLIKIPNSKYSLDFQCSVPCSVYRDNEYCADLSHLNIVYDMADYINNLLEENAGLKKTINNLEHKCKNSSNKRYSSNNHKHENDYMNEFEDSFY